MKLLIKPTTSESDVPSYAKQGDAGLDLAASDAVVIPPGGWSLVGTGIAIAIEAGYAGFIQPRSGLALKHGITVLNSPGLIDSGYRDEVRIILINLGDKPYAVAKGDRIAQLVVLQTPVVSIEVVDDLPDSERGLGGFGHTGA